MLEEKKVLTEEEQIRKDRVRFRLFILLVIVDIFLVGYLVFEMISVFTNSGKSNTTNVDLLSFLFSLRR